MIYQYKKPCKAVEFVACLARKGTVIFVVQRGDLRGNVRPSAHHDPKFAEACRLLSQVWIFISHVCSRFLDKRLSW